MNRNRYPVSTMCRYFGVSRRGYYDYITRMGQPAHDTALAAIIREQQDKCDKTYGYRRMWNSTIALLRIKQEQHKRSISY